jgi:ribosomal 50S subunit-recycling heat shock protein
VRNKKNSSRYRPYYKYLLSFRGTSQNQDKVLKFKKEKWKKFLFHFNQREKNRNLFYKVFDQDMHLISKFTSLFRRRFKQNLQNKRSLNLVYPGLTERRLKREIDNSRRKVALYKANFTAVDYLIEALESRLDVIIFRSQFVLSIRNSQQLIVHGFVYINGLRVTKKNYLVKIGDVITFSRSSHSRLVNYVSQSNMWPQTQS